MRADRAWIAATPALAVCDASLDNATQGIRALLAAQKEEEEKARAL